MIIGIGNDIVAISRIKKIYYKFESKFIERCYSKKEIDFFYDKSSNKHHDNSKFINFLAKRFSAKEALVKAIGIGMGRGLNFSDISITNNDLGKPEIEILNGKLELVLKKIDCQKIKFHLSLSDTNEIASAMVIIEKIEN